MIRIDENKNKEISKQIKPENLISYFPGIGEPMSKEEIEKIRRSAIRALDLTWKD